MIKKIVYVTVFLLFSFSGMAQINRNEALTFSPMFQIDSSEYFLIGRLIDKSTKVKYGASTKVFNGYTNVYVYNTKLKKSVSIFSNSTTLIYPFYDNFYSTIYTWGQALRASASLNNYILYLVQDTDFNSDGIIDDDDPTSIYLSLKNGDNLTRITPKDLNVISWSFSKDKNVIMVTCVKDRNADRKFINEDQVLYQIDISKDVISSKLTQVVLE